MNRAKCRRPLTLLLTLTLFPGSLSLLTTAGCSKQEEDPSKAGGSGSVYYTGPMKSKSEAGFNPAGSTANTDKK